MELERVAAVGFALGRRHALTPRDGQIDLTRASEKCDTLLTPHRLALDAVERRADDVVWLRYRVKPR
ncbi:MAG: hypothetical protein M3380_09700 [Chloroflexota bacterium]|nr:hypothetical protein [Chloroflexota bacterium]